MTQYYSPSEQAFFDDAIPVKPPEDSVQISEAEHMSLLAALNSGGSVTIVDGRPVVIEHAETLDEVKAARITHLTASCEAAIVGGYKSDALGALHAYPSKVKDQINMMGSVSGSLLPNLPADWQTPFWVCDAAGVWAWKMHNAAQIQQAGRDGKAHVVRCQTQLGELTIRVQSAPSSEAIAAIVWPEGTEA